MDHALALPIWDELDTGFIYFWLALAMMVAMAVSLLAGTRHHPIFGGYTRPPAGVCETSARVLRCHNCCAHSCSLLVLHHVADRLRIPGHLSA